MHFSVPGSPFGCRDFARSPAGHELYDVFPGFASFFGSKFVLQHRQDRSVKFFRLRHAHAVNFESDDVETGARENFDHAARAKVRKFEVVRLDQNERFFDLRPGRKFNHLIENAPVPVGKFGP